MAHLTLTDRPAPIEYLELVLCRDVYHCLPSELDGEDMERIAAHLICLHAESKCREQ